MYRRQVGKMVDTQIWTFVKNKNIFCMGNFKKDLAVFARTQRYKLYRDGRFFDLVKDRLEKNKLTDDALTDDQKEVKAKLKSVLDNRLEKIGR